AGDREGCTLKDGHVKVPEAYVTPYKRYCENGWMSVNVDPQWGGGGMPNIINAAVDDMMFGANVALTLTSLLTPGAARVIQTFGTDELKNTYLTKMFTGVWGGTMCLTESQAGSDVGATTTKAIPEDDHYRIQGDKIFITFGDHDMVDNIIHLVLARVEGAPKGTKGLSLFCIPKFIPNEDGTPGTFNDVECTAIEHKMGINGSPTCQLAFGANEKCIGWLVGEEGRGMAEMFVLMNEARINVGLEGSALASAAYQQALSYARERVQGMPLRARKDPSAGKTIVNHPDVAMMLMRQKAYAEGSRALVYFATFAEDMHEISEGDEAERWQALADIFTPIAKAYASDMGFRVADWAMQTCGGYGYLKDYPSEQYLRDSKIATIYEGTNGIQALDLVGRKLSMKNGYNVKVLDGMIREFVDTQKDHPYFKDQVADLKAALNEWGKITRGLAEIGGKKDYESLFLGATTYLSLSGDLTVAYFLLQAGVKAFTKLEAALADKGVDINDDTALRTLTKDNGDLRYLHGRLKVAQFFTAHELPGLYSKGKSVLSGDHSAMAYVWDPVD
ncbi:MAG: acyl-CoA dehydrogenase, partial [Deltaproteobacteria bacterium]|nr:acyl-CoA dehydrogenase [Deltaproteobacteria bacterium]